MSVEMDRRWQGYVGSRRSGWSIALAARRQPGRDGSRELDPGLPRAVRWREPAEIGSLTPERPTNDSPASGRGHCGAPPHVEADEHDPQAPHEEREETDETECSRIAR